MVFTYMPQKPTTQFSSKPLGTQSKNIMLMKIQELRRTNQAMEQELANMERKLLTIGDDSQLAQLDLQNWMNKQSQTMQMMSNMMKMVHDTSMAIINNLK